MTSPTSYVKTGYSVEQIPDLTGKVAVVTGGNTGLGLETVLQLARKGARVFVASRSEERAKEAIASVKKELGKDDALLEFLHLDLQDLKQVKSAAKTFLDKKLPLNILVNNAGIMACPFALTKDGIESQLGTNHVGHFALTMGLLPALQKGAPAHVVNVSSYAHNFAPKEGIPFDKINDEKAGSAWSRYGVSKLANILFTKAFDKRFGDKKIFANSLHPGFVQTELTRGPRDLYGLNSGWRSIFAPVLGWIEKGFALNVKNGALTQIYVATSPKIVEDNVRAKYFIPFAHQYEGDGLSKPARDDELAEKLWEWTEKTVAEKTA